MLDRERASLMADGGGGAGSRVRDDAGVDRTRAAGRHSIEMRPEAPTATIAGLG
jgi:hypothetical protein